MPTCGSDCDVCTFVGLEDNDVSEFSVFSKTHWPGLLHSTCQAGGGGGGGRG